MPKPAPRSRLALAAFAAAPFVCAIAAPGTLSLEGRGQGEGEPSIQVLATYPLFPLRNRGGWGEIPERLETGQGLSAEALAKVGEGSLPRQSRGSGSKAPTPAQTAFFETRIRPVLANNCYACHGPANPAAGLRLDSIEAILQHKALVPGNPDASLLIKAVRQTGPLKMPQGGKLKPEEIADLEAWVKMGAPWPAAVPPNPGLDFWSLQPVRKPPIPRVHHPAWVRQPLDAFVLAALESKHLKPAPEADRRTLLRRVTYDLTGLPPTPQDTDAFLADKSKDAYQNVVDRLLASPRYGERWARHWLDVARYADTKGYVFNEDRNYYNAYTYRDWVIDAFNSDLPYDRFIVQQLAADRLPEVQSGKDPRPLAALGFLTVGRRFLNNPPDIIDDRIDVTMRGFQGFTVACARCHDHKFDPIPTQDYYSLYAVFASSSEREASISDKSISEPWERYTSQLTAAQRAFAKLSLDQSRLLRKKLLDPQAANSLTEEQKATLQSISENQAPADDNLRKLLPAYEPAARGQIAKMQEDLKTLMAHAPAKPELAMAVTDNPNPSDGVVFRHGNPDSPGAPAPRRFLLALSKPGVEREHWTKDSGRLELAQAIASKTNPLTARVYVNRVWQDHFGMGIVATPSDFGHQGERPSNPALLDYLAVTFMENGWSVKRLQRMIVTSAAYRQSCQVSKEDFAADPENRLFGHMNRHRLDLEQMRDSMLAAAGRLDLGRVGGKSAELWTQPFTPRRAVYGFIERQNLPGAFRTFDFATPESTSPKRFQTTVPQQALFFMNSPFSVEAAQQLAARPEVAKANGAAQKVRALYRVLFQRAPTLEEAKIGLAYLGPDPDARAPSPGSVWSYGYGNFDPNRNQVTTFTPLAFYENGAYRVGKSFPDPGLGYLTLNAQGGHPGHDPAHAAIRRWTAPRNLTVQISGNLAHGQPQGDGVRARIVSGRSGLIAEWKAHNSSTKTDISNLSVRKGETIDFIVDPLTNDAYDSFAWAPVVRRADGAESWDARELGPPAQPGPTRLALYAQALLMTNEFMFLD